MRQREPASSRISSSPAPGSCTTVSALTRSAISGSASSPPMPSTWNGTPCSRSAARKNGCVLRARNSMAADGATVLVDPSGSRSSAARAKPARRPRRRLGLGRQVFGERRRRPARSLAAGRGSSCSTGTRDARESGATSALAASRMRAAVAPARRQREARGPVAPNCAANCSRFEALGAAPAVDRLVRVADRHDRMPGEQLREQPGLHDRRVLVLVEQHDAVARRAALDATAGCVCDDLAARGRPGRSTRRAPRRSFAASYSAARSTSTSSAPTVVDDAGRPSVVGAAAARRQVGDGRESPREAAAPRSGSAMFSRERPAEPSTAVGDGVEVLVEVGQPRVVDCASTVAAASCQAAASPSTAPSLSRPSRTALSRKIVFAKEL